MVDDKDLRDAIEGRERMREWADKLARCVKALTHIAQPRVENDAAVINRSRLIVEQYESEK